MKPNKKLTKVESTHRVQTSVNAGNVEKWHILPFCKNGKKISYIQNLESEYGSRSRISPKI